MQYRKVQGLTWQWKSSQRFKVGWCGSSKLRWKQSPSIRTNKDPSLWFNLGVMKLVWTGVWTRSPASGTPPPLTLLQQHQERGKASRMLGVPTEGKYSVQLGLLPPPLHYPRASKINMQIQWNWIVRPLRWNWDSVPTWVINIPLFRKILVTYPPLEKLTKVPLFTWLAYLFIRFFF